MKAEILDELVRARAEKRPVVAATRLSDGFQVLVYQSDTKQEKWLVEAVSEVLRADKGRIQADPEGQDWFLNPFNPPLRLVILGAVHIAQPLAKMAEIANYDVTVIDPRTAFASEERFPGVTLVTDWPDEAMEAIDLDTRTAVVTLTHDPKLDDPGLHAALKSPCFYIGALGSRKTHGSRVERLKEAGFSDEDIARIHGPVGLAIGARSPAEIAISIMAQMTERLRT